MIRAENLPQRLASILAARGEAADFMRDLQCVDDGDGKLPRLAYWDAEKLGAEPTQDEVDAVDVTALERNAAIDEQIAALWDEHDPTRGFTELAWAIAQIRDIQDQQISALVQVIRDIGGPSFATFDVPRVPDLKKNSGMVAAKAIIDARKQKT